MTGKASDRHKLVGIKTLLSEHGHLTGAVVEGSLHSPVKSDFLIIGDDFFAKSFWLIDMEFVCVITL